MKTYGKKDWAFSAGRIPLASNGEEPEFISHDKISVLNTSGEEALVEMTIFFEDEQPLGTYQVKIAPQRLRKIRFNDLIDPLPIQLEKNYSCLVQSNVPVVVQFSRLNSGERRSAEMSSMAFPDKE